MVTRDDPNVINNTMTKNKSAKSITKSIDFKKIL